jgi:hypothetical protein
MLSAQVAPTAPAPTTVTFIYNFYGEESFWAAKVSPKKYVCPFHNKNKKFSTFIAVFTAKFLNARNIF